MAVEIAAFSMEESAARLTLKTRGESVFKRPSLKISDAEGTNYVVLEPDRHFLGKSEYLLEVGKRGNLAPLLKGIFRFYANGSDIPIDGSGFKKSKLNIDGYTNVFYEDPEDSAFQLKIVQKWGEGEQTSSQRRENAITAYAKFQELPINENEIFFESMSVRIFNDNPRAIYEELCRRNTSWELVWALANEKTDIGDKGTTVRYKSLEYYRHLATAKYIVSNINQFKLHKRPGQIVINTMHGIPLKHMGLLAAHRDETKENMRRVFEQTWDIFVSPCDYMSDILRGESYNFSGRFVEVGYPRNDVIIQHADDKKVRARVRKALGVPKGKKLILYAPTFRSKARLDIPLDLDVMREYLSDEYCLAFRSHYLVTKYLDPSIYNDFVIDGHVIENTNDLLVGADVLITDFSSIMFDFSLMGRPMVLFVPDWEGYANSRGTYFDIPSEYPELTAMTSEQAVKMVKENSTLAGVKRFSDRFNQYETGHASADVVDAIWGKNE